MSTYSAKLSVLFYYIKRKDGYKFVLVEILRNPKGIIELYFHNKGRELSDDNYLSFYQVLY
jgi:hypothetical protein